MIEESTSEKLVKEAVKLCMDNAEQYHKDAELLIDNRSYGHAFALAVLGEEELAKAMMYRLCSEGLLPEHYELYLRKRLDKHLHKQAWAGSLGLVYIITELIQSIRKSIEEQAEEDFGKRKKIVKQKLKEAADDIREQGISKRGEMYELLERFATLQEDKNKGLYVDFDFEKKELTSPKSLKKDEVEKYLSQVKSRFEFVKPLLTMSFTPSEKKLAKAQLREAVKLVFNRKDIDNT